MWHQPNRPRWLLPAGTTHGSRPCSRVSFPFSGAHFLDFPFQWLPSSTSHNLLFNKKTTQNAYTEGAKLVGHGKFLFLSFRLFFFVFGRPVACEFPRPRIRSKPQLLPKLQLRQHWILNPLCQAGDWTCVSAFLRGCWSHCATAGTLTWEISVGNWIPVVCMKCSVSQCIFHSSSQIFPSMLFSFPVFFCKEFMSTTPLVTNFPTKQQKGNFSERKTVQVLDVKYGKHLKIQTIP